MKNYRSTLAEYGYALPFFPCMGNHDNDGATPSDENTDFEASAPFRSIMAPNYYSYNLGKVHFVVLDDIFYINSGSPSGTANVGSRNYKGYIPDYELDWLKEDLKDLDKNTPLIIGMHIPVWQRHTSVLDSCYANLNYNGRNSSVDLAEIVKDFKTVHLISGHTHWNHHAHPADYPNIHENNIAAICASWWYTGTKTGWHNCRDGCPGGYEMFHINGTDISYKYHSIEHNGNAQFHVLDVNTLKKYYQDNMDAFLKQYTAFTDFRTWADDQLLINVFSFDNDWKVEAVENGEQLAPQRMYMEDPYHMLTYDIPYYNTGTELGTDARSTKNNHMFTVQCKTAASPVTIRVTDTFGTTYEQNIMRPVAFTLSAIDTATTMVAGIRNIPYSTHEKAQITAGNGCIKISIAHAATACICKLNGHVQHIKLQAGNNEIPVKRGNIYIVAIGQQNQKLYISNH